MSNSTHVEKIAKYHKREAESEYFRNIGDDPVYDALTWSNIEPYLPERGWILDAGGGAGVLSIKMAETRKCRVVLLDITQELLKTAKRRIMGKAVGGRVEVLKADIRAVPHSDRSFDFVLCEADPICICGDPEKAVKELSRVLKTHGRLVAGVDSTLFRVFRILSQGKSLDYVLDFMETGVSPAEEEAPFDSKSFTPTELISLLQKYGLKTVKIIGKPIGFGPRMLDSFVAGIPAKKRREIFMDKAETKKLTEILQRIYAEPYIAGIGSHLQIVAIKK